MCENAARIATYGDYFFTVAFDKTECWDYILYDKAKTLRQKQAVDVIQRILVKQ